MRIKRRKRYLQNRTNMVSEGFYDYRDNKGHQCSLLGTTLGAFCVFFLKNELSKGMQKALMGFAAGVMVAASIWSLLLPALEQVDSIGVWKFLPAASGFWIGILFLMAIDHFAPSECIDGKCKNKLLLAVTIHNIPEGMAVGVIYAGLLSGASGGYSYRLGSKPYRSASAILFKLCSRGNVLCCSRRTSSENVCWKVCQCRIFHVFSRVYFDDDFRCCTCLTPCVKMHAVITIRYTV